MEREDIFVELAIVRKTVYELVKVFNKKRTRIGYDKSWVYIGKSTVHIHFKKINVASFSFVEFIEYLKKEFAFYKVYGNKDTKDIIIYLYGDIAGPIWYRHCWTH